MKTTFKLKVLTPMFMGGADPEGEPELRSASIRGAMRFWFTETFYLLNFYSHDSLYPKYLFPDETVILSSLVVILKMEIS